MPSRKVERRPLRKSAVGDMRDRINLLTKGLQPPVFGGSTAPQDFTLIAEVWAKVVTRSPGLNTFTDVNVASQSRLAQATHIFTIRYRSDVTTEAVIAYQGNYFEILNDDDTETRNEYLILHAKLLGDKTLEANQ